MDCVKRRRCDSTPAPSSKWADIPSEILDSIFEHLSLRDVIAAESVCTRWFSSAKSFITFKSQSQSPQCPLLLLFPQEDENGLENVPEEFIESACIGSSHGWLIFLDKRGAPLLFNPHLRIHIQFPYIGSLLGVLNIGKSREYGCYITYDCQENPIGYVKNLRENLIHKAIISSDPLGIKNFGAVVIYGYGNKLAYCKNGLILMVSTSLMKTSYAAKIGFVHLAAMLLWKYGILMDGISQLREWRLRLIFRRSQGSFGVNLEIFILPDCTWWSQ